MANFGSGEPISGVSGSIFSSFLNSSISANTGISGFDAGDDWLASLLNSSKSANTGISANIPKLEQIIVEVETGTTPPSPIYRGVVGSNYVFSVGSPPVGATFVAIIGFR